MWLLTAESGRCKPREPERVARQGVWRNVTEASWIVFLMRPDRVFLDRKVSALLGASHQAPCQKSVEGGTRRKKHAPDNQKHDPECERLSGKRAPFINLICSGGFSEPGVTSHPSSMSHRRISSYFRAVLIATGPPPPLQTYKLTTATKTRSVTDIRSRHLPRD